MKKPEWSYDNKPCSRCYSIVNRFDAERIVTNYRGEKRELFFHPETCYQAYIEGREMVKRGVTGIEIDKNGDRINLEHVLGGRISRNQEELILAKLAVAVKNMDKEAILHLFNKIKEEK